MLKKLLATLLLVILLPIVVIANTLDLSHVSNYSGAYSNDASYGLKGKLGSLSLAYHNEVLGSAYKANYVLDVDDWFGFIGATQDNVNDISKSEIGIGWGWYFIDGGMYKLKPSLAFFFNNDKKTEINTSLRLKSKFKLESLNIKHIFNYIPEKIETRSDVSVSYKLSKALSLTYQYENLSQRLKRLRRAKMGLRIDFNRIGGK